MQLSYVACAWNSSYYNMPCVSVTCYHNTTINNFSSPTTASSRGAAIVQKGLGFAVEVENKAPMENIGNIERKQIISFQQRQILR